MKFLLLLRVGGVARVFFSKCDFQAMEGFWFVFQEISAPLRARRGGNLNPERAEALQRSAIYIKYTVVCLLTESIQSINRDVIAICNYDRREGMASSISAPSICRPSFKFVLISLQYTYLILPNHRFVRTRVIEGSFLHSDSVLRK